MTPTNRWKLAVFATVWVALLIGLYRISALHPPIAPPGESAAMFAH